MNLLEKVALGGLVTIGTSIAGIGTNHLLNQPYTIGEELQREENLSLLNDSYSKWQDLVNKHKSAGTTSEQNPVKINEFRLSSGTENINDKNKKELQDKCQKLWDTEISKTKRTDRDRMKKEIRTWCATNPKALVN